MTFILLKPILNLSKEWFGKEGWPWESKWCRSGWRLRLDKIIQKVRLGEEYAGDPYVALIKRLALNEKLDFDTAKLLITEYKKLKGGT